MARGSFVGQDRSDMQYAVKELSQEMAKATQRSLRKLRILGRYLIGRTRYVVEYKYQPVSSMNVSAQVDTDFAGCIKSRKSASGGVVYFGQHAVKSWSTNQAVIALSSGEAEYYGLVKGSS